MRDRNRECRNFGPGWICTVCEEDAYVEDAERAVAAAEKMQAMIEERTSMFYIPIRTTLPTGKQERKDTPIASGVLDYFPAALAEVARVSKIGNDQHNPGQPMHWARHKSTDQADCIVRHLMERGTIDEDGGRHSAKMAWRALALLQQELEDAGAPVSRGSVPAKTFIKSNNVTDGCVL